MRNMYLTCVILCSALILTSEAKAFNIHAKQLVCFRESDLRRIIAAEKRDHTGGHVFKNTPGCDIL
jgi:hypothetical protein